MKSTESGLAIPDWPLAFGALVPPLQGGVIYEYTHRVVAGLVAVLTVGWAVATQRAPVPSSWKAFGWFLVVLVVLQALLGGLTVLWHLPPAVSIAHAFVAQAFLAGVAFQSTRLAGLQGSRVPLAGLFVGLVFLQLLLGAVFRHVGTQGWALAHAVLGFLLLALVHVLYFQGRRHPLQRALGRWLLGLFGVQIVLGVLALWIVFQPGLDATAFWPALLRSTHLAVGAVLLALSTVFWAAG